MLFDTDHGAVVAKEHGIARSSRWPAVEKAHLKEQPWCVACQKQRKGIVAAILRPFKGINVHHIIPFHIVVALGRPDLELDNRNLITLCRVHHLLLGHLDAWDAYNPQVKIFCVRFFAKSDAQIRQDAEWRRYKDIRPKELQAMSQEEKDQLAAKIQEKYPPLA